MSKCKRCQHDSEKDFVLQIRSLPKEVGEGFGFLVIPLAGGDSICGGTNQPTWWDAKNEALRLLENDICMDIDRVIIPDD